LLKIILIPASFLVVKPGSNTFELFLLYSISVTLIFMESWSCSIF
jgi:hypothetical protein